MTSFERLLEVQDHDTAVDRLRHSRTHLPERAELAALQKRDREIEIRISETTYQLRTIEERQATLESEAADMARRIRDIEKRMYSGEVSATRDLLAMTAEIEGLKSRCSSLEDQALGAMEEAEPLGASVATMVEERAAIRSEAVALQTTLQAAEVEIEAEVAAEEERRARAAEGMPADLLQTYEKLRSTLGGVGAARLVGTSCSGCHLTLPASEVARMKREPPDTLVLCDQCGRILVR